MSPTLQLANVAVPTSRGVGTMLALGDSYSCGVGVGVRVHPAHTWIGVLGHCLGATVEVLAQPGARIGHVRAEQLPTALERRADLATVFAGLNDVCRTGWSDAGVTGDLLGTVKALRDAGTLVLLGRPHDAGILLPLTRRLRAELDHRLGVLRDAVDAARAPGVVVVDFAAVPELYQRAGWGVDRVHPSIAGHRGIAAAARGHLVQAGIAMATPLGPPTSIPPPSQFAELRWLARHGAPYLVRNASKTAASLAVGEPASSYTQPSSRTVAPLAVEG